MKALWPSKRKTIAIFMGALFAFSLSACGHSASGNTTGNVANETSGAPAPESESIAGTDTKPDQNDMINVDITIGNHVFAAKFYNNESTRTILSEMPFTLDMDDYASQEKVIALPFSMPSASTETPSAINCGDIYLWSGNSLVLFYTTFSNAYSYVPVGYIVDVEGLTDALGRGSVTVAFQAGKASDEDAAFDANHP